MRLLTILAALSSFPDLREGVSTPGQRWAPPCPSACACVLPLQGKGILGVCVGGWRRGGSRHVLRLGGGGQGIGRGKRAGKKAGKRSEERREGPKGLTIDELDAERRRREEIEAEENDGKVKAMILPLNFMLASHPPLSSLSHPPSTLSLSLSLTHSPSPRNQKKTALRIGSHPNPKP